MKPKMSSIFFCIFLMFIFIIFISLQSVFADTVVTEAQINQTISWANQFHSGYGGECGAYVHAAFNYGAGIYFPGADCAYGSGFKGCDTSMLQNMQPLKYADYDYIKNNNSSVPRGALIFYGSNNDSINCYGHVGIYDGNGNICDATWLDYSNKIERSGCRPIYREIGSNYCYDKNGNNVHGTNVIKGWSFYSGYTLYSEKHYGTLDVNAYLDGKESASLGEYATCNVYLNGQLADLGNNVTDYWNSTIEEGTKYRVVITPNEGYILENDDERVWEGTIVAGQKSDVSPHLQSIKLKVNGYVDGVLTDNLANFGTFDVLITYSSGIVYKKYNDISYFFELVPDGMYYEITDFKGKNGYKYTGLVTGEYSNYGRMLQGGTTTVTLSFEEEAFDPESGEWYVRPFLPSWVTSDQYEIEYQNSYTQVSPNSPGSGWIKADSGEVRYEESGGEYSVPYALITSNTRRLINSYYYHYHGSSSSVSYAQSSSYPNYHGPNGLDAFDIMETYTDSYDSRIKSYKLKWNTGQWAGGIAWCSDQSNRSATFYRNYVYQDYNEVRYYTWHKNNGWEAAPDNNATTITYRFRLKNKDFVIDENGVLTQYTGENSTIIIPSTVKEISSSVFDNNADIEYVYIPDSVTKIGDRAFANCIALQEVRLPDSAYEIGEWTFANCGSLEHITSLEGIDTSGRNAFQNCYKLKNILIRENVKAIQEETFYGCVALEDISIPASVQFIGTDAIPASVVIHAPNNSFAANWANENNYELVDFVMVEEGKLKISGPTRVTVGQTITLVAYFDQENQPDNKEVTWDSKNKNIATVSNSGIVSGISEGTTEITACSKENNSVCNSINITVNPIITPIVTGRSPEDATAWAEAGITGNDDIKGKINGYDYTDSDVTLSYLPFDAYGLPRITSAADFVASGVIELLNTEDAGTTNWAEGWNKAPRGAILVWKRYLPEYGKDVSFIGIARGDGTMVTAMTKYGVTDSRIWYFTNIETQYQGYVYQGWGFFKGYDYTNGTLIINNEKSYTVTFQVVNGSWDDGTDADKSVILRGYESDELKLISSEIPPVGTKPNKNYKAGEWDFTPNTDTVITEDTLYKYIYAEKNGTEEFVIDENGALISYNGSDENVVIPDEVLSINDGVFKDNTFIKTVKIPNSVTAIGENAFQGCTSLTSITIPGSIKEIPSYAFLGCTSLGRVDIYPGVETIGFGAFRDCINLGAIAIPSSVKTIGEQAFVGCKSLSEIEIPSGVETIGFAAFSGCSGLTYISINNSVTTIEGAVFSGCISLKNVILPSNLTLIKHQLFQGCSNLSEIVIPNKVTSISRFAFDGCENLERILIPDSVQEIGENSIPQNTIIRATRDSFAAQWAETNEYSLELIDDDHSSLLIDSNGVLYGYTGTDENIVIPNGVKAIADSVFSRNIRSVTIPESVTIIDEDAFDYNLSNGIILYTDYGTYAMDWAISHREKGIRTALKNSEDGFTIIDDILYSYVGVGINGEITVPANVQVIGSHAFKDIYSVVLPEGLTTIESYAFYNNEMLSGINIPDTVTIMGDYVFYDCQRLEQITIPRNVSIFGTDILGRKNDSFLNYAKFTVVYLYSNSPAEEWVLSNNYPFRYIDRKEEEFTIIDNVLYSYNGNQKNVIIPSYVTEIAPGAFQGNTELVSVTIPDGVRRIGHNAFSMCTGLKRIVIPEGVTTLEKGLFSLCYALTEVILPESLTSIGNDVFYCCLNLSSIEIPAGVRSIGMDAFFDCQKLTSITIPFGVTAIEDSTFVLSGLTDITLPESITTIGDYALNCNQLTSVMLPNSITSIGLQAFNTGTTLYAAPGSYAAEWAKENGARLHLIGDEDFTIIDGVLYSYTCTSEYVVIPNNVSVIGNGAFAHCGNLTSLSIPNSVTSIGDNAFADCSSLSSITIPNSVTSIGNNAFSDCGSLESITLPGSLTTIGANAIPDSSFDNPPNWYSVQDAVWYTPSQVINRTGIADTYLAKMDIQTPTVTPIVPSEIEISVTAEIPYYPCTAGKQRFDIPFPQAIYIPAGTILPSGLNGSYTVQNTDDESSVTENNFWFLTRKCENADCSRVSETSSYPYSVDNGFVPSVTAGNRGVTQGTTSLFYMKVYGQINQTSTTVIPFSLTSMKFIADGPGTYVVYAFAPYSEKDRTEPTNYYAKIYVTINPFNNNICSTATPTATPIVTPQPTQLPVVVTQFSIWAEDRYGAYQDVTRQTVEMDLVSGETLELFALDPNDPNPPVAWRSSSQGIAEVSQNGVVTGLRTGTATITAANTLTRRSVSVRVRVIAGVQPGSLEISGANEVAVGRSVRLSAVFNQDPQPTNRNVVWSSSNPAVARVTNAGQVSGISYGSAFISACAKENESICDSMEISVFPAASSVTIIDREDGSLMIDLASGYPYYQLSAEVSPAEAGQSVTWRSSSNGIATVDENGMVTGHRSGTATITATTADGSRRSASVRISIGNKVQPGSLEISGPTEVAERKTIRLNAVFNQDPQPTNRNVIWMSSDPSVASVNASGMVTGQRGGTALITVCSKENESICDSTSVSVFPVAASVEIIDREDGSLMIDLASGYPGYQLAAQVYPADAGQSVTWRSSSASIATVDEDGFVTGHRAGTATITATTVDGSRKSASVRISIGNKVQPGSLEISGPAEVAERKTIRLNAVFNQDPQPTNRGVIWMSSAPNIASVNSSGNVTGLSYGSAEISVCSRENDTICDSMRVSVFPVAASVEIIDEGDGTMMIDLGSGYPTYQLSAHVLPESAGQGVTWRSSSASIASVDDYGLVTGYRNGTATITATASDGSRRSASVRITVGTKVQPGSLSVSGPTEVAERKTIRLSAVFNQEPQPTNRSLIWTSSDPNVARVNNSGAVTGVGGGDATITVCAAADLSVCAYHRVTVLPIVKGVLVYDAENSGLEIDIASGKNTYQLGVLVDPMDASQNVEWRSSSVSVATVDENGLVTASGRTGTVTITARAVDGSNKSGSIRITVKSKVQAVRISGDTHVDLRKSIRLNAYFDQPVEPTVKGFVWTSSDPSIARVNSSGVVTGVSDGIVTIRAAARDDQNIYAEMMITVGAFYDSNAPKMASVGEAADLMDISGIVDGLAADEIMGLETVSGEESAENIGEPLGDETEAEASGEDTDADTAGGEDSADESIAEEDASENHAEDDITEDNTDTEVTVNEAEDSTEETGLRFTKDEIYLKVGESVMLEVENPDEEAILVGLGGDTDAVLWNDSFYMVTSIGEAEVTAFLSTIDPVEIRDMVAIHVVSELPESVAEEETAGDEVEEIAEETVEETVTEEPTEETISEESVTEETTEETISEESVTEEPAEETISEEAGITETAEPTEETLTEGEPDDSTEPTGDEVSETVIDENTDPEDTENSEDQQIISEENADELTETDEEVFPVVTVEPTPEPANKPEIRIRDLDDYEDLSGTVSGVLSIERERFELEDEVLTGLVFEIENEAIAKLTDRSDEELLLKGIEIQLLNIGETKLKIKLEGEDEPLREIRLVVTAVPAATEEPAVTEEPPVITEQPTESAEEPTAEMTEEPVAEVTEEPVIEATEEPVIEVTEEPVIEATEEPVIEVTEEPVIEAAEEPVIEVTEEPVIEATEEPVIEVTEEPVIKVFEEPVFEIVEETAGETEEISESEEPVF